MDVLHSIMKFVHYNRGVVVSILIALAVGVWMVGCQPTTPSLFSPGQKVTATELQREVSELQANLVKRQAVLQQMAAELVADNDAARVNVENAIADLERQVEMRKQIIAALGAVGEALAAGTFNPAAGINALVTLLVSCGAVGLGVDNLRKIATIKSLKNGTADVAKAA